jgi:membrane protein implicated in regulation of membrane protease activity
MNKLRIIVTAVFILAATYGMFTRLVAKIDQVPWWRIALFIAVFAAVVFFLLSAIKRSSGKIKEKRNEKNGRNRSPQNEAS